MKKIIKTLLVVMVVVLALAAFTACEQTCQHSGGTATCTAAAVCEKCGESYGEALGHTGGTATCTEGAKCDLCGEVYIAALGHSVRVLPALEPTCAKEGLTAGERCKDCGVVLVAQETIEKLEHVWVDNVDRDFTCTLDGFVGGKHCENCGIQDGTVEIIPAHHVWGEEYVHTEPTCGKAGILAHDCTVCGEKEKVADIPATGEHNFTVDVEAQAPTCKPGYTAHKACEVCGAPNEEYEEIAPTGHTYTEPWVYEEATCTENGIMAIGCTSCGGAWIYAEIPASHKWEGGDCDTVGTCTVCGEVQEAPAGHVVDENGVCSVCGNLLVYTAEELIEALGAGKNVILMNDIVMDATLKCPYGNNVGVAQRGGSLDGNGYTLTVNGSGNYYAIITYGGTIKNLTINSGFRAIVLYTPTEDVIIDNVTIYGDDIVYGLNTAEYPTLEGIDIVVKNSTICGWVSFAGDYASVSFENCEFVQGVAYDNAVGRLIRPYLSTTFTNCTFVKNAYLDLSALVAGETVTLVNCKVAGVDVTVDVFTTVEDHEEIPFTYEAPAGVELVLTAVEGGVSFHRHGHTLSETVASSCTVAGKEVYTCACGDSYENALELGEHDYDHVVTAPTCTVAGYTTHTCAFCDDTYTDGETEALGHADENGDYKCDRCSTKMLPADGTALTVEQALVIAQLGGSSYTTQKYYITGIITSVPDATWGNFYLTDANGDEMLIYGLYSFDGSVRYDAMTSKPVKGDEITVYTVLGTYNGTPQGKNAWIDEFISHEHVWSDATCKAPKTCSVCEGTEGAPIDHVYVDGVCSGCGKEEGTAALTNATLSFANKAQRTEFTTSVQVWEQNGVKVTNNKSSSTNAVADYASPARFYAGSNLVVEGAGMTKIVFDCNSSSYATALKNSIGTQAGVTVTVSSDKVTVTFDSAVDSFTVNSFTAQVRMDSITVNP